MKGWTSAELERTKLRSARMRMLVDLIPARFYLPGDNESQQLLKSAATLDPSRAKSTSQLVAEAAIAARSTTGSPSAPSASGGEGTKKRKHAASAALGKLSPSDPRSRLELRQKLEMKIRELREERRRKQSEADKAKAAEIRAQRQPLANGATPPKKSAAPRSKEEDTLGMSRLIFESKPGNLPFSATVGQRGAKAHKLHNALKHTMAAERQLKEAEAEGRGEEVRKEQAMQRALARARGEKVHDNVSKIRKAQNALDKKKLKSKDVWSSRTHDMLNQVNERQAARNENLKKRSSQKKKGKKAKLEIADDNGVGFEGKRKGFLNKDR